MEKNQNRLGDKSAQVKVSSRSSSRRRNAHYVFGAALAGVAMGGVPSVVNHAHAAVVTNADFTFETSGLAFSASVTQGASPFGPVLAEIGTGSAYGSHAATSAVYSSPSGNGSNHSFSSNVWAAGDYYKFVVPTTGIQNVIISFDQISSSTGPKVFDLIASSDGTNFTYAGGTYTISLTQNATSTGNGALTGTEGTSTTESTWNPTYSGAYNESFALPASFNNDPNAVFEIVETDTTTATAGTDRVDNVIISGTTVPEPAELSLLTVAAAALMFRRRNNNSKPA